MEHVGEFECMWDMGQARVRNRNVLEQSCLGVMTITEMNGRKQRDVGK